MTEGTDMNQIEKALSDYLGDMCGMRLKPHALTGLAKAAIAAMPVQAEPQWQGIDSAPRDGTDLIVAYTHIATVCVFNAFYANPSDGWDADDEGWWTYTYSEVSRVKLDGWQTPTHWMPLPTPPAGGSDAE